MNAIPLVFNAPKANINVNSVSPINVNSIRTNNKLINATQGMNIGGAAGMLGGGGFSNEAQLRQEVNTSLLALKREAFNLETLINQAVKTLTDVNNRIAALENVQGDYVKKTDITDTVQSGNMNPVTSNAVANSNAMPVNSVTSGNMHSVTSNAVDTFLVNFLRRVKTVSVASNSISITDLSRGVYLVFTTDLYHNYYNYNLGVLCYYDADRVKFTTISQDNFPIEASTDGTKLETTNYRYFYKCNFYQVGY
jgi:hypothetical protein